MCSKPSLDFKVCPLNSCWKQARLSPIKVDGRSFFMTSVSDFCIWSSWPRRFRKALLSRQRWISICIASAVFMRLSLSGNTTRVYFSTKVKRFVFCSRCIWIRDWILTSISGVERKRDLVPAAIFSSFSCTVFFESLKAPHKKLRLANISYCWDWSSILASLSSVDSA